MLNNSTPSKWAVCSKLLFALPCLSLLAVAAPSAQADDHYGRLHHEIREDERHGDYGQAHRDREELHYREGQRYDRGYYHDGRYYRNRHAYYYNGRRQYNYVDLVPGAVSVQIR